MNQIDDTEYDDMIASEHYSKRKSKSDREKSHVIDVEHRERVLLSQLLNNAELFIKGIAFLEKDFFESKINRLIVGFIKNYYENYKSIPPEDAILIELGIDDARHDWLDVEKQWPSEYLEDYLNAFIKNMSMKGAIEDSIELLESEDYGAIEKKIKDAVNVDLDIKLGVTIDNDKAGFKNLFDMLTSQEATIPTGWDNVDEKLDGGVTVPSLNYILAKSGGGKCVFHDTLVTIKVSKDLYNRLLEA
jgi:hypothetical protein